MIIVKRYQEDDKSRWDDFVDNAKNGHFMFKRDYMEYHADRFQDHSLLFEENSKLIAIMPANQVENNLYSHGGLTFGGVVSDRKMNSIKMLEVFAVLKAYAITVHITRLIYKVIPSIYALVPAEEDLYALFINNARLVRRDLSTTIDLSGRLSYSSRQKRNINKGKRELLEVLETKNFYDYWQLLSEVLKDRHGVNAVHALDEINSLSKKFPDNILVYEARNSDGELLAGTLLYINSSVVHTQYLANSEKGRKVGALDFLIDELLGRFSEKRYFDFGVSTVDDGRTLNEGLVGQKEGFGGRAIVHDFYELDF